MILDVDLDEEAARIVAGRSRGTPRIANRLLKRVRDYAQVRGGGDGRVTAELATDALDLLEIDERGLDAMDRQLLRAMAEHHAGGPVGLRHHGRHRQRADRDDRGRGRALPHADRPAGAHLARAAADPSPAGSTWA